MLQVVDLGARLGESFEMESLSFSVAPGELLAVLGPNGSGKSTLLRLVVGLEVPRTGVISWNGNALSTPGHVCIPPERRGVGLLFQEGVLFPHLDVRANVALGLAADAPRAEIGERVKGALEILGIGHLERRRVSELSGGEQQRVALARILVQRPRIMLLDEPFHSLDHIDRVGIMTEIRSLVKKQGLATVFVTHDVDEAAALADRVLLLRRGRKVQEGPIDDLYRHPADIWAARFLGEVERLSAELAGRSDIGLPEGYEGEEICFRPEDLVITPVEDQSISGPVVIAVRPLRTTSELTLELPDGTRLLSTSSAATIVSPGERVQARIVRALPAALCQEHEE